MAAAPNHVGSPHDKANADFMVAKFNEWGWDAHIETFQVLYPTPKKISVELVAPTHSVAKLQEPAVTGDRTSAQIADELPPYHVYGADGDVTAELVYVNQGMPDDYKKLASHGIDVKGKIAIARYGGGWRGLKPKFAYEHGAIGCIVYSDPRDDGYGAGDAYPKGGFRPADGVQRGSVMDLPVYPGDPLTPGVGATADAKRLPIAEARTVLKYPCCRSHMPTRSRCSLRSKARSCQRRGAARCQSPTILARDRPRCISPFRPTGASTRFTTSSP